MMIATSLAIAGAVSFITSIVVARSVGVTEFGFYSITTSLQSMVVLVSGFSLGMATAKFVAEHSARDSRLALSFARAGLRLLLVFASVTSAVYFALAGLIGDGIYGEPSVADLIPFSALVVFSNAMLAFMTGVSQGKQRFRLVMAIKVSTPVICLGVVVILLPIIGVKAAFIGFFIAQITVAVLAMLRLGAIGVPLLEGVDVGRTAPYYRALLMFAVPSVMSGAMVAPVFWFGNTVLTLESGFLAMGYFGVALVFFNGLSMLATSISVPLMPRVSEMSTHSLERVGPLITKSMRATSFLFFPLFFTISVFSREIIAVLYGADYYESGDAASLVVIACYYCAVATPIGASIAGMGRMWVGLGLNMVWAVIFLVLAQVLIPLHGIAGLGMAYAASYGVHVMTSLFVANTILRLRVSSWLVALIPSTAFFAVSSVALIDLEVESLVFKAALVVLGSAMMVYLGRMDFKYVASRILVH